MGVSLDDEEKGILKYLDSGRDSHITLGDLTNYLSNTEYEKLTIKDLRNKLDHLVDLGYVRSKTEGKGDKREEIFYLSEYLGSGVRKKRHLQGRGLINDTSRLVRRLFGSFFLLIGLGLFLYEIPNVTGAVVSSSFGISPMFFSASTLVIIGFLLLINSFRKN